MAKRTRIRGILGVFLLGCLLSACAVVHPYRDGSHKEWDKSKSFDNAVLYAENTRSRYLDGIRDHTWFNRGVGTVLVGAAAAAAGVGMTGGSTDVIIGLGVGGAGVLLVDRIWYRESRLEVYLKGAQAIDCLLSAYAGMRQVNQGALVGDVDRLNIALTELDGALGALRSPLDGSRQAIRGHMVVAEGRVTLERGAAGLAALGHAGVKLHDDVHQVHDIVVEGLLKSEPDISEIVGQLNQQIPSYSRLIGGAQLASLAAESKAVKNAVNAEGQRLLDAVEQKTAAVVVSAATVERELRVMVTGPDTEAEEQCLVEAKYAADPLRASVGDLWIDSSAAKSADPSAARASVQAKGGKPPYHAAWKVMPGAHIQLTRSTEGTNPPFVVTVSDDLGESHHELMIGDAAEREVTVGVHVLSGKTPGTSSGVTGENGGGVALPTKDEDIQKVQRLLIKMGCMPDKGANGKTNDDGIWGDNTNKGLDRYLKNRGMPRSDIEATIGKPGEAGFAKKLDSVLAKEPDFKCSPEPVAPAVSAQP